MSKDPQVVFWNDPSIRNASRTKPKVEKPTLTLGPSIAHLRTKKTNKFMEDGKTITDYRPRDFSRNHTDDQLRTGGDNKTPANHKTDPAPSGFSWKTYKNQHEKEEVTDFENSDIFSDFHGNFFLKKVGNTYKCWIDVVSSQAYDKQGNPSKIITPKEPICVNTWTDTDGSHSFALGSIAAYFAKHNITEDNTYHPHIYNDVNMGCGAVKYWNIIDGGNDNSKPHIIAHAGETIIIDTGRMKVIKSDGTNLTKFTSFASSFPPLHGGLLNTLNFFPSQGGGCDVNVEYVPRIR